MFTRGGKLSSRPTGGELATGYGLAIAKDFVTALGGDIWFKTEPAGGTTFSVAVPLYDRQRHAIDRRHGNHSDYERARGFLAAVAHQVSYRSVPHLYMATAAAATTSAYCPEAWLSA